MCWQIFDTLVFNGLKFDLSTYLLEKWLDSFAPDRETSFTSTSCYRGYIAIWAIKDGELILTKVESSGLKEAGILTADILGKRAYWVTGKVPIFLNKYFTFSMPETNAGVEIEFQNGQVVNVRFVLIPDHAIIFDRVLTQRNHDTNDSDESAIAPWNDPPKIFRDWLQNKRANDNMVVREGLSWGSIDDHFHGYKLLNELSSFLDSSPKDGIFRSLEWKTLEKLLGEKSFRYRHSLIYEVGDRMRLEDSTRAVVTAVRESEIDVITDGNQTKTLPHAVPLLNPYYHLKVGDRFVMDWVKESWLCTENLPGGEMRIKTIDGQERLLSKLLKSYGQLRYRSPQESRDYLHLTVDRLNDFLKSPAFRGCIIQNVVFEPEADGVIPTTIGWISIKSKMGHINRRPVITGFEITELTFILCALLHVFNKNARKYLTDFVEFYGPNLRHLLTGHLT